MMTWAISEGIYLLHLRQLSKLDELSHRQKELALAFAKGISHKEIALMFDISPDTVRTHLTRVYKILGIRQQDQARIDIRRKRECHLLIRYDQNFRQLRYRIATAICEVSAFYMAYPIVIHESRAIPFGSLPKFCTVLPNPKLLAMLAVPFWHQGEIRPCQLPAAKLPLAIINLYCLKADQCHRQNLHKPVLRQVLLCAARSFKSNGMDASHPIRHPGAKIVEA